MKLVRLGLLCLLSFILIVMPTSTAFALEDVGVEIHYAHGACTFDFYKLADYAEEGHFVPTAPFDAYADTVPLLSGIEGLTTEEVRLLSTTMESIVLRDAVAPTLTARTDADGRLSLTPMEQGAYLVLGEPTTDGVYRYTPSPIVVTIPARDPAGVGHTYVVVEHNKVLKEELDDDTTHREVIKIWEDDGNESRRPAAITVQLLQDGAVYDTVQLTEQNNWFYRWTDLPANHTYTATEVAVPKPYTLSVERDRTAIYITNTYNGPPPPPPPDLPPTGQLWWPVPVLLALGICSLALGTCYGSRQRRASR